MKHAKKSLLVPILALFSALAITVFAVSYITNMVFAYAESEPHDYVFTNDNNSDSEINYDKRDVFANIHFSSDDVLMSGYIYNPKLGYNTPFFNIEFLPVEFIDVNDIVSFLYTDENGINVCEIGDLFRSRKDTLFAEIYIPFYKSVENVIYNYIDDTHVDITIVLSNDYYIAFDANGGKYSDGSYVQYIEQAEGSYLKTPVFSDENYLTPPSENLRFAGWFTERWGGERVFDNSQVPEFETYFVLYAHWAYFEDDADEINVHFSQDSFFKQFKYTLEIYNYNGDTETFSSSSAYISLSDLYDKYSISPDYLLNTSSSYSLSYDSVINSNKIVLGWINHHIVGEGFDEHDDFYAGNLTIYPNEFEHINQVTLNGENIPSGSLTSALGNFNNVVISTALNLPGYINVSSDNGQLFQCTIVSGPLGSEETHKFVSDYVPIFVGVDETVTYGFGFENMPVFYSALKNNAVQEPQNFVGVPLWISVTNGANTRNYLFSDYLFTLFDWFDMNSYIEGVSLDGEAISASNYMYSLDNGYHDFVLRMSGEKPVPPTPPDPPVPPGPNPPEPVPPEPGPTPDPVNPGGGGAQTGDSMPLAPIAVLAIVAALCSGLALRKESSK